MLLKVLIPNMNESESRTNEYNFRLKDKLLENQSAFAFSLTA